MKRSLSLFLILVLAFSLASCGGRLPKYEDFPST